MIIFYFLHIFLYKVPLKLKVVFSLKPAIDPIFILYLIPFLIPHLMFFSINRWHMFEHPMFICCHWSIFPIFPENIILIYDVLLYFSSLSWVKLSCLYLLCWLHFFKDKSESWVIKGAQNFVLFLNAEQNKISWEQKTVFRLFSVWMCFYSVIIIICLFYLVQIQFCVFSEQQSLSLQNLLFAMIIW